MQSRKLCSERAKERVWQTPIETQLAYNTNTILVIVRISPLLPLLRVRRPNRSQLFACN